MYIQKKETITFRTSAATGTSGTITERVKARGVILSIQPRFYPGQENTLQIRPYVRHKVSRDEPLVTYPNGANQYLSGDDDAPVYAVSIAVENDDEIHVYYSNTGAYTYTVACDVTIQYMEGS